MVRQNVGPVCHRRGLGAQVAVRYQRWKRHGGTPAFNPRGFRVPLQPSVKVARPVGAPGGGVALQVEARCRVRFCFISCCLTSEVQKADCAGCGGNAVCAIS